MQVWLATFMNTALIVLLVNAALPSAAASQTLLGRQIFVGQESGFTLSWHYSVGAAIVLTMAVNSISPHLQAIMLLAFPPKFREKRKDARAVTQAQLNSATMPPPFEIPTRVSVMLNIVFCCIMYSPGHPILHSIAAMSFAIFYAIDKWALLRVYRRPQLYDETLTRFAARLMPWAGLCHLAVATWTYSDPSVMYSPNLFALRETGLFIGNAAGDSVDNFGNSATARDGSNMNIVHRISLVRLFLVYHTIYIYFLLFTVHFSLLVLTRVCRRVLLLFSSSLRLFSQHTLFARQSVLRSIAVAAAASDAVAAVALSSRSSEIALLSVALTHLSFLRVCGLVLQNTSKPKVGTLSKMFVEGM